MTELGEAAVTVALSARLRERARERGVPAAAPVEAGDDAPSVQRDGGVVLATCPDDTPPCARSVVERARERASTQGGGYVVTCNRTDLFLFDGGESDTTDGTYRYVDLRDGLEDAVAAVLDAVEHAEGHGRLPTRPAADHVAGVLRSVHAALRPRYEALARAEHGQDERFTRAFDAWTAETNADERDERETLDRAAGRHAYLRAAEALVSGTDRPVTGRVDGLFGAFPESDATSRRLRLARSVTGERLGASEGDPLGAGYEELLTAAERTERGQFYTHPTLAETVCRWAIRPRADGDPPRVLDPAAGSGTFLLEAVERLGDCHPSTPDGELLERVSAVDLDRLALHLAALNLVDRYGEDGADSPRLRHASFFDLAPGGEEGGLGSFDAVVGNPPYIRQEALAPDRDHFRAHLAAFGPEGATPYLDGSKRLSERSDAYVYFVTHATQFLREGGRLGVVVPTKWLTTRYGEPFRTFLADHYRVEAVVGFSARAFADALVDTALLLVERCGEEPGCRAATTNFVRVEEPTAASAIVEAAAADHAVSADAAVTVDDGPTFRTVAVDQGRLLAGGGKLAPYLRAPAEFIRLLTHPQFTELGELAEVSRGVTTGANDFFFLDATDRERWDVDARFLAPALKSLRDVESRVVRAADTERYLFDVHDYVREVERATGEDAASAGPDDAAGDPLGARVKRALARDGYDGVLEYVEWGEAQGFHERRTCASRDVWFDLGPLDPPEVLHPKFFDERVFVVRNPDGLVPGNAVDRVRVAPDVDEAAVLGVLDSTVNAAMLECWGRAEGGGALQLMTYEVASLPVLDVRELDAAARERIARHHERLVAGEAGARAALDRAVLDAMDADLPVERLWSLREAMTRRRVHNGREAEVLVGPGEPSSPGDDGGDSGG
jgi:hypothetical protein